VFAQLIQGGDDVSSVLDFSVLVVSDDESDCDERDTKRQKNSSTNTVSEADHIFLSSVDTTSIDTSLPIDSIKNPPKDNNISIIDGGSDVTSTSLDVSVANETVAVLKNQQNLHISEEKKNRLKNPTQRQIKKTNLLEQNKTVRSAAKLLKILWKIIKKL